MKIVLVAGLLVGGLLLLGPAGCTCTEVGCLSGVTTTLTVEQPETLVRIVVTVCRNDDCQSATLVSDNGINVQCAFENDGSALGPDCTGRVAGGQLSLDFSFYLADDDISDDDNFRFVVSTTDDPEDVLAQVEGKPEYTDSSPNGEWCGPTCSNAKL